MPRLGRGQPFPPIIKRPSQVVAPYGLPAAGGAFALTGGAAGFGAGLDAGAGSFAATGGVAAFDASLAVGGGDYALAGGDAGLTAGALLAAAGGSHAVAGGATAFDIGLATAGGALALTGGDAGLTAAAAVLDAGGGSYALAGAPAPLGVGLAADGASFALAGAAVSLISGAILAGGGGSFALAGGAVSLLWGDLFIVAGGALALTGGAASLAHGASLAAAGGTCVVAGGGATLTATANAVLAAGTGLFAFTAGAVRLSSSAVTLAALTGDELDMPIYASDGTPWAGGLPDVLLRQQGGVWYRADPTQVSSLGPGWIRLIPTVSDMAVPGWLLMTTELEGTQPGFGLEWTRPGDGPRARQATPSFSLPFFLVAAADGMPLPGATPDVAIFKPGATAFTTPAGSIVEVGRGVYEVLPDPADIALAGELQLDATAAGADPFVDTFILLGAAATSPLPPLTQPLVDPDAATLVPVLVPDPTLALTDPHLARLMAL